MYFSNEVVIRARAELARQKEDKESLQAARLREAYRKVPRLQRIDVELRSSMAAVAQAAFSQGTDVREAMAAIQEKNLALQAEYRQLTAANFPEGWLDESPICPICGGTGYMGSAMCQCLQRLCIAEQRKTLGSVFSESTRFETFRLDYYSDTPDPRYRVVPRDVMAKHLEYCRSYARSFQPDSGNLLFNGSTGVGKTHLALSVGAAVGEQGYSVCYETAIALFSKLEKARFSPTEEVNSQVRRIEACDLLIVDDLGTEMPGQFVTSAFYGLLNDRLLAAKPMLITTNLNVDEVRKRYGPQIASRFSGEFRVMPFLGPDIRVLKNK